MKTYLKYIFNALKSLSLKGVPCLSVRCEDGSGTLMLSLHGWSENILTHDPMFLYCQKIGIGYLRPDYSVLYRKLRNNVKPCGSRGASVAISRCLRQYQNNYGPISKLIIFGSSGGGLHAIRYAAFSKHPIDQLLLVNPIVDMKKWKAHCRKKLPKYYFDIKNSEKLLGKHFPLSDIFVSWDDGKLEKLLRCTKISFLVGKGDLIVPPEQSRILYKNLMNRAKNICGDTYINKLSLQEFSGGHSPPPEELHNWIDREVRSDG